MSEHSQSNFPKVHNAMWPGLVGKGGPGDEPCIDLDTMLDLTAAAEVDGVRFDGVDIFLFEPHVSIDSTDDDLKRLADRVAKRNFVIGSLVAPVWPPTGGGSAMGSAEERKNFLTQLRKACAIAESHGERLAAEGEICWGGMHSWKHMAELLVLVNRPKTLGLQSDMAHTLLFTLGYNAPHDRILPEGYDWSQKEVLYDALASMTRVLRPWVVDFHVAQND